MIYYFPLKTKRFFCVFKFYLKKISFFKIPNVEFKSILLNNAENTLFIGTNEGSLKIFDIDRYEVVGELNPFAFNPSSFFTFFKDIDFFILNKKFYNREETSFYNINLGS